VDEWLVPEVVRLKPKLNRNYLPGHKKGGSVSYYTVREEAPAFLDLYKSPVFMDFLSRLVGERLMLCTENDPHACALYYYTGGDHIAYMAATQGAAHILVGLTTDPVLPLVCQLIRTTLPTDERTRTATSPAQ
jgi:hypothetical protein